MNRQSTLHMALGILTLLTGSWAVSLWAVDLRPGWIEGQASVATEGQIVQSLSINAYGGGYRSSKSIYQAYNTTEINPLDYSLTVQGGSWPYQVTATATARPTPASCPTDEPSCYGAYTTIYFSNDTFPVAIGETVTNDYTTDATVQFQLSITDVSDPSMDSIITSWRAYGYAYKSMPAGEEQTNSRSWTYNSYTPSGIWEMPVISNDGVQVYARVYVYGNAQRPDGTRYNYSKSYYVSADTVQDIGPNQIVAVPLHVDHEAPPPPIIQPYDTGTVEGTVQLNLDIAGNDYSDRLRQNAAHYVWGYQGQYVAENGGSYSLPNERVGNRYYRARSYFDNGYNYSTWPYSDGDPANDLINVEKDQFYIKDFNQTAGLLTGELKLQGTAKTDDLTEYRIYADGARFYEIGQGWINQLTYGGYGYNRILNSVPDMDFEFFLTEGPWQTHSLYTRSYNYDPGYYVNWQMNLTDYNRYYDGNYYDFGQTVDVVPGAVTKEDRRYRMGSWESCFVVVNAPGADPITFQVPSISAWANFYNEDGKREMYVSSSGNSNSTNEERPTVKIHAPGGEYTLSQSARLSDGTNISFPTETVTIKNNIARGSCLTAPELILDPFPLETNESDVTVSGEATDEDGIATVIFTQNGVEVHRIDYTVQAQAQEPILLASVDLDALWLPQLTMTDVPLDGLLLAQTDLCYGLPCSVIFSYSFELVPGINTLRITVVDSLTNESWEEWETFVNSAPEAVDDIYDTPEDTQLSIVAPGVLINDSDVDGHTLTVENYTEPSHGTLVINQDGSFTYTPNLNFHGSDGFSYTISDGHDAGATATVLIEVTPVNDLPVVTPATLDAQSVQYSDRITPVTIDATDVDSHPLSLEIPNLLNDVNQTGGCTASGAGSTCSWTLDGQALAAAGPHTLTFEVDDGAGGSAESSMALTVTLEDATADFDPGNPAAVAVATPGGVSGPFDLTVQIHELDESVGDITKADVSMSLVPVGPGDPVSQECTPTSETGVSTCSFSSVAVNTYTIEVTIGSNYYTGSAEDVLTVYDPSLGFTTGGGWFYWPGTSEKTNFGYTMKYGKDGKYVKGSLLVIRHLPDGQKYRIKSNALGGLAIGEDPTAPYGWASFSGKATYLEPGMLEAEGNHGFTVYVEDRNEPGSGNDRFWIATRDKDGNAITAMSLSEPAPGNAIPIQGGNIVAPH